ncbi:MAG: hypothetical protein H8E30_00540 [Alphaproteobacteria bacterium]|nr:hypothetical protein [Alphaproteobacteria bacterium]
MFCPGPDVRRVLRASHNRDRGSFVEVDGVKQPGPAPRFSRTPSAIKSPPPEMGADTAAGLKAWGLNDNEIAALMEEKAIGWQG